MKPFTQSAIGEKCDCGVPEDIRDEQDKRFLVPKGSYGGFSQPSGYYSAWWMTLVCQQCKQVRHDFNVWKWHSDGSRTPVIGAFAKERDKLRHADLYEAIKNMMPE